MDPNLLRHIEYFLEPNSQVRTLPRCAELCESHWEEQTCEAPEAVPLLTRPRLET